MYGGRQSTGGGGPRGSRNQPQQKVYQPSISYDVHLKTSDNAWKPGKLAKGAELNEQEKVGLITGNRGGGMSEVSMSRSALVKKR